LDQAAPQSGADLNELSGTATDEDHCPADDLQEGWILGVFPVRDQENQRHGRDQQTSKSPQDACFECGYQHADSANEQEISGSPSGLPV
jgi:hypothetical protein